MLDRDERINLINENIKNINRHFNNLSKTQINNLYNTLQDVLFFYGIGESEARSILKKGEMAAEDSTVSLTEFYEFTNAMLFQIKYKMLNRGQYQEKAGYSKQSS